MTQQSQTVPMTDISGYFNPNDYPIQLNISALQIQLRLGPKEFVQDTDRRKINDPILASYVGPNKLAAEKAAKPVPTLFIRKPEQRTDDGRFSFAGKQDVGVDAHGNIPVMPKKHVSEDQQANTMSVRGYTVEEAVKAGLIRTPNNSGDRFLKEIKDETVAPNVAPEALGLPEAEIDLGEGFVPPQSAAEIAKKFVEVDSGQLLPDPGKQDKVSPPGSPTEPTQAERAVQEDVKARLAAERAAKQAARDAKKAAREAKKAARSKTVETPEPQV